MSDPNQDFMLELQADAHHAEQLINRIELCLRKAIQDKNLRHLDNALEGIKLLRQIFGLKEMA